MPKTDRKKILTFILKSTFGQMVTLITLLAFSSVTTAGCSRKKPAESNQAAEAASGEKKLELGIGSLKISLSGEVPDVGQMVDSAKESAKKAIDSAAAIKNNLDGSSEAAMAKAQNLKQKALNMAEKLPEEDLGQVAAILETIKKTLGDLADSASDSLAGEDSATDAMYQKTAELLQKNKVLAVKKKTLGQKDELLKSLSDSQDELGNKFSALSQKMSVEKLSSVVKGIFDFSAKEAGVSEKEQKEAVLKAVKMVSTNAEAETVKPADDKLLATPADTVTEPTTQGDGTTDKDGGVVGTILCIVAFCLVGLIIALGIYAVDFVIMILTGYSFTHPESRTEHGLIYYLFHPNEHFGQQDSSSDDYRNSDGTLTPGDIMLLKAGEKVHRHRSKHHGHGHRGLFH